MHTESRKMVQMSLLAGQEERHRHREWTCGHSGGRGGWNSWESGLVYTHYPM